MHGHYARGNDLKRETAECCCKAKKAGEYPSNAARVSYSFVEEDSDATAEARAAYSSNDQASVEVLTALEFDRAQADHTVATYVFWLLQIAPVVYAITQNNKA